MSEDRKKPVGDPRRDGEEAFLQRWSRRKSNARRGEDVDPEVDENPTDAPSPAAAPSGEAVDEIDEATLTDAELAERRGLPDPATLEKDSDYSAFMRRGVPDRLRTAALRRLWRLSPDIGGVDDLLEYGEDFSDLGAGVVQTAYEVGSGFAKRIKAWELEQAEKERAEKERAEQGGEDSAVIASEEDSDDAEAADASETRAEDGEAPAPEGPIVAPREAAGIPDSKSQETVAMTRRRMRFRFEADGQD